MKKTVLPARSQRSAIGRRTATILAPVIALGLASAGARVQAQELAPKPGTEAPFVPPPAHGFDPELLDRSAAPCEDFYQFACGRWLSSNPVPATESQYNRHEELQARNEAVLHGILERAARPDPARNAIDQKIGDHYASCMDAAAIEKVGAAVLAPQLADVDGIKTRADLAARLAGLHKQGVRALFQFGSRAHPTGRRRDVGFLEPLGMALGGPGDYLKDDARHASARERYRAHVQRMLELLGDPPARAAGGAATVLDIETALARAMPRDTWGLAAASTDVLYRERLAEFAPPFDWAAYFKATADSWTIVGVTWPEFFVALGRLVESRPLADWKAYLRWRVVDEAALLLPSAFVAEKLAFQGWEVGDLKAATPRWRLCLGEVETDLGWELGARFMEAVYTQRTRDRAARMVAALERALDRDIQQASWLSEPTRQRALAIRAAIVVKIGGPEGDGPTPLITRGDPLGNFQRAAALGQAAGWESIDRESDPKAWKQLPTTLNAFYDTESVSITLPAAILQPPFLDLGMDDAVTFGSTGGFIGHELMHAFDVVGQHHGDRGQHEHWTGPDAAEFEKRASCFVRRYSEFKLPGGASLDGRRVLNESLADASGLRIAYMALQDTLAGTPPPGRDGFTAEQRFFLGYGQGFCSNESEDYYQQLADGATHPPARLRVNGVVSGMPEFQKAFSCLAGSKMVRENPCRLW